MKKLFLYLIILVQFISCKESGFERIIPEISDEFENDQEISTPLPYPIDSVFTLKSITSSDTEKLRLDQNFNSSDFIPTGWFAEEGSTITVHTKRVKGDYFPTLLIGTYNRDNSISSEVKSYILNPGNNKIQVEKSGLIYIRFKGETDKNESIIKFINGVKPVAFYKAGKTTKEEWQGMLNAYTVSPDVILYGGKIIMVVNRRAALDNIDQDQNLLLTTANQIWEWEEDFSGLDNSSATHMRNPHNHLMTESSNPDYYMAAYNYGTFYNGNTALKVLVNPTDLNSWGPWHELGHHHQQASYLWSGLMEVTVNLYSMYVQQKLGRAPELKTRGTWPLVTTYLAQPTADKIYDNITEEFVKLAMFRQLWLAFGDGFYIRLHKYTRENKLSSTATDASKREFFMLNACRISGRNLTNFFQKWGFSATTYATTYTKITALNLPIPSSDLTNLQDQ